MDDAANVFDWLDSVRNRPSMYAANITTLCNLVYYEDRYVDDWFLMLGDGSHDTAQSDLFDWVSDEFGIDYSDWDLVIEETV